MASSDKNMIERIEISWFGDFSCLCEKCPNTCCRGWVIPLSERDRDRLKTEKGILGIGLFLATEGFSVLKFNSGSGKCPFHGHDGLCRIQKKKGHDFIPWTCQSYPRFYRNYGNFEEACLDLSCPAAASLFIKNSGSVNTISSEGDAVTETCTTNDDPVLLDSLMSERMEMMTLSAKCFDPHLADALFKYAVILQDHYAKGDSVIEAKLSFNDFYNSFSKEGNDSYAFPLLPNVFGALLASPLCHIRLKKISPRLYAMLTKAKDYIRRCEKGETDLSEDVAVFLKDNPQLKKILGYYMSYYLFQYYLRTYETYSFRRQIALGLIHTNMILLFAMTSGAPLSDESLSMIISVYNRRAYFNDNILDSMYRIFESNLPHA